jgi:multiple sugar transport system substrate-binding protein
MTPRIDAITGGAMPTIRLTRGLSILAAALLLVTALPAPAQGQAEGDVSFAFWGDPAEAGAYEEVIATFENEVPGIDVAAQYTPGRDDYAKRVSTAFAGGAPPDVFLINYRDYGQYAASGALEPLGARLDASDTIAEEDFYELPIEAFRYQGGELMCIPQNISSLVVYYNVDLFEQAGVPLPAAGWTLDDFVAAATALTVDKDGDGVNEVHGLVTESSLIRYAPFIWSAGGEIVDDTDHPTRLTLDTPEAREAIEWFINLGARGHDVVPSEAEVLAEDDLSRFMHGRAAMLLQSRRVVPTLREIDGFRWDVAPLPQDKQSAGILHSDAFCMSTTARDKNAAWAFIEYAVGPAGQEILARTGRTVPSMKSVAESPVFLDGEAMPPSSRVFLDTIPALRRVPSISTWPEIEDIFNAEFQQALSGEVDLDTAIANVEAKTEDAFRRAESDP